MANTKPNSTIYLYNTQLYSARNAYVDDIDTYLGTLGTPLTVECQYVKHDLDIDLKLALPEASQSDFDYNYAKIVNYSSEGVAENAVYYYITKLIPVSQNTISFVLRMDTLNTLGQEQTSDCNPRNFDKGTYIERQHEDRFVEDSTIKIAHGGTVVRKISKTTEEFNPNVNIKTLSTSITESKQDLKHYSPNKWYLIFSSSTDSISNENTTFTKSTIHLAADSAFNMKYPLHYLEFTNGNTYWTGEQSAITRLGTYYLINASDAICKFQGLLYTILVEVGDTIVVNNQLETINGFYQYFDSTTPIVYAVCGTNYYDLSKLFPVENSPHQFKLSDGNTGYEAYFFASTYYYTDSEAQAKSLVGTRQEIALTWRTATVPTVCGINNTSSKILTILELPYCPIEFTIDNNGVFYFGLTWQLLAVPDTTGNYPGIIINSESSNALNRNKIPFPFSEVSINSLTLSYLKRTLTDITLTDDSSVANESKLYNSQFFTSKLNYDSFNYQIKPERFDTTISSSNVVGIKFKASKEPNSTFGFKISLPDSLTYNDENDYDQILITTRSNEYPLYNDAYLNYMRNGYNYDVKANKLATQAATNQAILSGVSTVGSVALSTMAGFAVGNVPGAIAAGTGALSLFSNVSTSINSINTTIEQQNNSLAKNIANLQAQGQTVNCSNDLSMLNWYNYNKLHYYEYTVSEDVKQQLARFFYYFGYKNGKYEQPEVDSRIWFNYIKCTPVLRREGKNNYKASWVDDLKTRYQNGVTVYHHNNVYGTSELYDIGQNYENYESWMF